MIRNSLLAIIVIAVTSACACGKKKPELPAVEPDKFVRYASGLNVESKLLGKNINFDILLPADYLSAPDKRYPVVYMCHGLGDNNTSWNDKWLRIQEKVVELEAKGLEPMIYVFPNASKTYYCNKFNGKYPYMDFFVQELVPYIDMTYRTIADREHRATVGYSMGGFGAYVLAAKHPEVFSISAPLSMSFRTDEQYMTEPQDGWNFQWASIFDGENAVGEDRLTDYYKQHCPFYVFDAANRGELDSVHWFLHCGDDEEQLLIANDDLHVQMRDNGFKHEFRVADGAHTSSYWRLSLNEVLPYIQSVMGGNEDWKMTLTEARPVDVELDSEGVFCSKKYNESEETGVAFYLAYEGLSTKVVTSLVSIIQRSAIKNFAIIPCDTENQDVVTFVEEMENRYHVGGTPARRSVLAIGDAGAKVLATENLFGKYYLEDASLPDAYTPEQSAFYYIGQNDESFHYREMGQMYKMCKKAGIQYEYRCRNNVDDPIVSLQLALEMMKEYLPL